MSDSLGGAAPHVVMLAGNDVRNDGRIRKTALSLARLGLRVTLVGLAPDGLRTTTHLGPVTIVRLPVAWTLRDASRERRARRRTLPRVVGYRTPGEESAARTRARIEFGRAEAQGAPLSQQYWRARGFVVRARSVGHRRLAATYRNAWRARDKAWSAVTLDPAWPRLVPHVLDYDVAYGPVIDALEPDVIHAHDVEMLPVAAHAAARAARAGRPVPWVYDAHEYVPGLSLYGGRTPRVRAAWTALEHELAPGADAVITVSPAIAERMATELHLARRPVVTLNTPVVADAQAAEGVLPEGRTVRGETGLPGDVPLVVYSGGVTAARGVRHVIDAMEHLPGVHLAIVPVPFPHPARPALEDVARKAGVADRVHWVAPSGANEVVGFLCDADVGVHPLEPGPPNHEMALPNKLFEYAQAGLALVVSDCAAMAEFVRAERLGAVFAGGDPVDLARAVREVLDAPPPPRTPQWRRTYRWQAQEGVLADVYADLLGPTAPLVPAADLPELAAHELVEESPGARRRAAGEVCLLVGPRNMAGQGWAWAKAVERAHPAVVTEVVGIEAGRLHFPADRRVPEQTWARDTAWQQQLLAHVLDSSTHVLLEAARPLFGLLHGRTFAADADVLRSHGVAVALVLHGSEIRDPARHAARNRFSPFADPTDDLTRRLVRAVGDLAPDVAAFEGPVFVSTPDLLDDVPGATWLPVVVDPTVWAPPPRPAFADEVPLVVHAPSRAAIKGTGRVEPVLERLAAEGVLRYERITDVPPEAMPDLLGRADVVLDQFALGSYGVLACQGLALGRVVVGHVAAHVRERVPAPVPVVEADPTTIEAVLRGLAADPEAARAAAAAGPEFVARFHDGARSAQVLAGFLGL